MSINDAPRHRRFLFTNSSSRPFRQFRQLHPVGFRFAAKLVSLSRNGLVVVALDIAPASGHGFCGVARLRRAHWRAPLDEGGVPLGGERKGGRRGDSDRKPVERPEPAPYEVPERMRGADNSNERAPRIVPASRRRVDLSPLVRPTGPMTSESAWASAARRAWLSVSLVLFVC
jgi:hypothetical protein